MISFIQPKNVRSQLSQLFINEAITKYHLQDCAPISLIYCDFNSWFTYFELYLLSFKSNCTQSLLLSTFSVRIVIICFILNLSRYGGVEPFVSPAITLKCIYCIIVHIDMKSVSYCNLLLLLAQNLYWVLSVTL